MPTEVLNTEACLHFLLLSSQIIFSLASARRQIRMYSTVFLLLIFALSSVPVEAIDTSLLAEQLSHCIVEVCSLEMSFCHRHYGVLQMDDFKECIKELCTEEMKVCLDLIMAERIGDTGVEVIRDSFLHCFRHCGFQNQTKFTGCFLEALVDKTQPYISMLAAGSSDPDFLWCWLSRGLGAVKSCFHHYSELSYTVIHNIVSECVIKQECVTCFMKVYTSGNKKCLQMFMQLFGSTPTLQIRANGFFICSINEMISLTATC